MKNVFKMLCMMMLAVSVSSCIIVVDNPIPVTATQTSQEGIDAKTVKVYYNVKDANGTNYSVNPNGVSLISLDNITFTNVNLTPRAIGINSVVACTAKIAGQGCFQITAGTAPQGANGVSGGISFKLDGAAIALNYNGTFLKPPVPASVTTVTTEGVSDVKFKVYFTAKTSSNQPYNVNQAGLTEITLANVNQTSANGGATRAVVVVPVTSAVSCAALNAGQGCFEFTLGSRSTKASITVDGTVSFKLDAVALQLPFAHTFPVAP